MVDPSDDSALHAGQESLSDAPAPHPLEEENTRLRAELDAQRKRADGAERRANQTLTEAKVHHDGARHKLEAAKVLRTEAAMSSHKQAAAPGGWDRPLEPVPGLYNDRIRQPLFDALERHMACNVDLPRGLRSSAKEILARIKRLHDHKLTPNELELMPLLEEWEARDWRPDPSRPQRMKPRD